TESLPRASCRRPRGGGVCGVPVALAMLKTKTPRRLPRRRSIWSSAGSLANQVRGEARRGGRRRDDRPGARFWDRFEAFKERHGVSEEVVKRGSTVRVRQRALQKRWPRIENGRAPGRVARIGDGRTRVTAGRRRDVLRPG